MKLLHLTVDTCAHTLRLTPWYFEVCRRSAYECLCTSVEHLPTHGGFRCLVHRAQTTDRLQRRFFTAAPCISFLIDNSDMPTWVRRIGVDFGVRCVTFLSSGLTFLVRAGARRVSRACTRARGSHVVRLLPPPPPPPPQVGFPFVRHSYNQKLFQYFSYASDDQFEKLMLFTAISLCLESISVFIVWWYMWRQHRLGVFVPLRTLVMGAGSWFYVSFLLFAQTHVTNDVYTARVKYDACCADGAAG